jgi:hypothetical protein
LKNPVQQTRFFVYFTACVACKNPVQNRQTIKCRSTGGLID